MRQRLMILSSISCPNRQQGVVLLVGLIMLLLMTIVGLAAIRGSNLQEVMAGNMRERQVAFQTAEAGLRVGEQFIENQNLEAMAFDGNAVDWQLPDLNQPLNRAAVGLPVIDNWNQAAWQVNANSAVADLSGMHAAGPPLYVVERLEVPVQDQAGVDGSGIDLGSTQNMEPPEVYRLSSRGESASGSSDAVVQISYRKN